MLVEERDDRRRIAIPQLARGLDPDGPVIGLAELDAIAEVWVDAAMRLEERDLKMMSWLVRAQQRRMEETPAPLPVEPAGLAVAAAI